MKKTSKKKLVITGFVVVVILGILGGSIVSSIRANAVRNEGYIYVPSGATYQQLLDSLGKDGEHLISISKFRKSATVVGLEKKKYPGRYLLKKDMSYGDVAKMFKRGLQSPVRLTFNNIRTIDRLAGAVSKQLEPDSVTLYCWFTNDTLIRSYGFTPETFISMFIPNTYEFYWNTSPERFIEKMNKEYKSFWSTERMDKLKRSGLTPIEASTLASIVYEETKMSDEMPTVAGVYINRMKIGMPLQADPTVKFALGDFSIKRVLNAHLEIASPYNTYRNSGLPPGPICMPSIKAIDAVLNYKEHQYLYFCASPDFSGYHNFATNLADHNRNAQIYSATLNRLKIMR